MPSRVAQVAARLVETGWLAAVIVVPLFFDVWSSRVFEPDKLTLLRTLAVFMVAAALVVRLELGLPRRAVVVAWLGSPMVLPVLLLSGIYALSSATSVVPYQSVTGGFQRLQGLYTWMAYVVLFLCVVALLRERSQLDRVVHALILPSLPVGLYGIVQKFGKEIMPWQGDTTERIASTMGNSIFVAAYLILVVPLTIVKLTEALRELETREGNAAVFRVSAYLVVLAIQILAVIFSQSRGPLLGLVGALFFLALLMASLRATRRAMLGVLAAGAAIAAFLVVFNLPNSPLAPLREVPYLGRMGRVFETTSGTGRVRVLIWEGAVDLITADPVRTAIGWGPESMHVAYTPYYRPELGGLESRNASPDRSHNETFDALVTMGVLGLVAYLLLFTSLFYHGLKWLGFIDRTASARLFLALWIGGGAASAVAFQAWSGSATYFGVALPAGMIAGLFTFITIRALQGWTPPARGGLLLVAGLMAGIIAHFIEINFGIAIAATRTLFFVMSGALVAVGAHAAQAAADFETPDVGPQHAAMSPRRRRKTRSDSAPAPLAATWASHGFLMLTLLTVMTFAFLVWTTPELSRFVILLWLFAMTWGFGTLVLATETLLLNQAARRGFGRYAWISLGGFAICAFAHWLTLSAGSGGGAGTSSALLFLFYGTLLTVLGMWAAALAYADPARVPTSNRRSPYLYGLAFVVAAVVAIVTNVNEVRADIYYKQAWVQWHGTATNLVSEGRVEEATQYYDLAVSTYDRAISLDSREDYYQLFRGKALLEGADAEAAVLDAHLRDAGIEAGDSEYDVAELADEVATRDRAFANAIAQLEVAREGAPLNTDHTANLGRAYQVWADRTLDAGKRAERFDSSRQYFTEAIALSPSSAGLHDDLAMTEYLAGDHDAARKRVEEALAIDPKFGRPLRLLAIMAREEEDYEAARDHYEAYFETRDGRNDAGGWSGYAFVVGRLNEHEKAIEANERVLEILGRDDPDTVRNLALLYDRIGDTPMACAYVERAMAAGDDDLSALAESFGCGDIGGLGTEGGPTSTEGGPAGTEGGAAGAAGGATPEGLTGPQPGPELPSAPAPTVVP